MKKEAKLTEFSEQIQETDKRHLIDLVQLEDLRARLSAVNPYDFEELLKDSIERNGFYRVAVTKRSGDGGIDVNAYLGPNNYFAHDLLVQFQAKRWRHSVGRREIAELRGSLESAFGVIVTTSNFTKQAIQESKEGGRKPVMLIDGINFARIITSLKVPIERYLPHKQSALSI